MARNQVAEAQYLYDERSARYDDSWHPRFAQHVVELIAPRPGEHVLDLACGTGLVSFAARNAVGDEGSVVGVDISKGMLNQARKKLASCQSDNLRFHRHSITDLATLEAIKGREFDVITCASALVLLENPGQALKLWTQFLKPGGRLITDVTHPQSQLGYITLERVGKALLKPLPFDRLPFQHPRDLQTIMEAAGLRDIEVKTLSQLKPHTDDDRQDLEAYICEADQLVVERTYRVEDAEQLLDRMFMTKFTRSLSQDHVKERAKALFMEYWTSLADQNGTIEEIDAVFVGLGRKL